MRKVETAGVVGVDEVISWQQLARRFGFSKRQMAELSRRGLRSVTVGHKKLTSGKWVMEFLEALAEEQEHAKVSDLCESP